MMDKVRKPKGTLYLLITHKDGTVEEIGSNLIVSTGYNILVEALAGKEGASVKYVAVGANGSEAKDDDTTITDSVAVEVQSVDYPDANTVRFNFNFGYEDAVGMKIREFGLITADGRLFSRKTREILEKTQHMTISGHWEITI